ncbi:hypothetical protein DPSP01_003209 [Paraphaeosphaeria sporulosa]|uniref:Ankyrin n=1 Tax=Paraphaeosphaeria sporulosa TaxID=1460663 RepID=A0A177C1D6_9PLEO|nr:ankyrin [Paraphaeosphaeria sporulosa]OAG01453.1 ankyrin [Paraphaeosphaeria sporulosa]
MLAAARYNDATVSYLLEAGAQLDSTKLESTTELLYACDEKPYHVNRAAQEKSVQLLCKHGADVNVTTWDGKTPFLLAAANLNLGLMRLLVAHGTAMTAQDMEGTNALTLAGRKVGYNGESRKDVIKFFGQTEY